MAGVANAYPAGASDGRPGIRIRLAYDADRVDALKRAVPHTEREWDEVALEWWVAAAYERLLRRMFPNIAAFLDQPRLPL